MRILVACEYSGRVRDAFLALGHDAMSCDLLPTEAPGPHYQGSVLDILDKDWDEMVAFPPCDHLSKAGARWWPAKQADGRQAEAIEFVRTLWNAPIPRIAIENPVGILSSALRKPDQIIQPWQFGDPYAKATCLWLKGLPRLIPAEVVESQGPWVGGDARKPGMHRDPHKRSLTFLGIARAMAAQWG